MLIALRELIDEAGREIDLFERSRMKAGRWTVGNFTVIPTHGKRHSKAHKETISRFDRNSLALPRSGKIYAQ
jgi:hypothetical protein